MDSNSATVGETQDRRARIWRTLTQSPPTFVPALNGGQGDGGDVAQPTRVQLRRRAALSPEEGARPERLRSEWVVAAAGLGYHMSVNSDRLMWSAEFGEADRCAQIVTPRCSASAKRRARLALAGVAAVTVLLFAAVVQLEPESQSDNGFDNRDGRGNGNDEEDEDAAYLFTVMTFAAVMSAIVCFTMLAVNAMMTIFLGELAGGRARALCSHLWRYSETLKRAGESLGPSGG